jgi:predicted CXXCH cytochrome family protein
VRILITVWAVLAAALGTGTALAQHPDLGGEKPTNELCLTCHEDLKKQLGASPHKAVDIGCAACHDVLKAERAPFLPADVNAVCLACHQPPTLPAGSPLPATVELYRGFSVPGAALVKIRRLSLDKAGVGHPVANHPVSGREDPLKKGRAFTCLSCHVPHGSASPRLLAFPVGPGQGICGHCHKM